MKEMPTEAEALRRWGAEVAVAFALLTRIPMDRWIPDPPPALIQATRAFPIVGLALGLGGGLVLWALTRLGAPSLLAAAIALACLSVVTGALHEDGFADMVDGFGGGRDREDVLAIMRDSRIGTFGVLALVLVFLAKAASLDDFAGKSWYVAPALLAGTGAFSRSLIVWVMGASPPARLDGLSASAGQLPSNITGTALLIGTAAGLVLLSLAGGIVLAIIALIAGFAAAALIRDLAERRIGGQTGDVLGGVQVISETAMLAIAAIMIS